MATTIASDDKPQGRSLGNLALVYRAAARYPGRIAGALLFLGISSAATLAIPRGFKEVIDRGFSSGTVSTPAVSQAFHYLLMIVLVLALATGLRFYFVSWLGERTVADLRRQVQRNLLTLPPRFFEENRPSEIASRLTADTAILEQVVGSSISFALRNFVTGVGGIVYLFVLSPKLAGLLLIAIPLLFGPIILFGRKVRTLSRDSQDRIADVGSNVSEVLGAMKIVQAFGQEKREEQRFADTVERAFATARTRMRLRAVMTVLLIGMFTSAIVLVIWEGAIDVAAGRMTGGDIAAFVFTGLLVGGAFAALSEIYGDLLRASGAAGRIAELIAARAEISAPASPVALPVPARGALTFDEVEFRYPTRPDQKALHGLSLAVAPGETVAVVGPSGAGKSTLFQLALRFYDPQGGRISFDGVDLRDCDPGDLRSRIALVPQETVIFAASARDNLRYGRWDASEAEIEAAARAANAHDFLTGLPQGYDTYLGESGARLSGGQRQRIAIARALLRDAPLLLLDEATSALDAESEASVQQALERLMESRTTVVIAHRLATVRAADRIIVMEEGRIVEEGNHASLTARGGLYARLARLQFDAAA
ncbi:ABC transporter transmembrane domain-containing protein [Sphingomonas astaxanthinifaciens]|uniref:ABC transporter ATP-binding protein/permease n=1 Tax=Sphingomonas astaxanthinifaciens DSM 22298 TaxID=1123267 RepID=A0ABQ5Z6K7_9SPHN|nr:ABC transporter transmembrane domain-containing protein [Sphingomonas astaxanthinifaciens]GLR47026.1 ABC transporter ATP-binding protein/permease [Sphingomonas astaxanthinifaciens DSM 22298]